MESNRFYNEILTEHNIHPEFKHDLPDADIVLEGINPSCGDDIFLKLKVENGVITDGAFVGDGCAISQASADIMLGMIIGKPKKKPCILEKFSLNDKRDCYGGRNRKSGRSRSLAGYLPYAGACKMCRTGMENLKRSFG